MLFQTLCSGRCEALARTVPEAITCPGPSTIVALGVSSAQSSSAPWQCHHVGPACDLCPGHLWPVWKQSYVSSASTPTRAAPDMVGEVANTTGNQDWDQCVGTCVPGLAADVTWAAWAARVTQAACHTHGRWAADIRNPASREHLWTAAVRSAYTTASSAAVHPSNHVPAFVTLGRGSLYRLWGHSCRRCV